MSEYLKMVFRGTDLLFGENQNKIQRNKTIDTKKELRLAKNVKKTSILKRSSNRVKRLVLEATS